MSQLANMVARTTSAAHMWVDHCMSTSIKSLTWGDLLALHMEGKGYLDMIHIAIDVVEDASEYTLGLDGLMTKLCLCRDHVVYELERLAEIGK